jgi:Predicted bile acid beta-glucosidase
MSSKLTTWPVLTRHDHTQLAKIALPLGGIGTGTISLGGRGDLRDWEIVNRPAKGFTPRQSFFAIYVRPDGGEAKASALEGPLDDALFEGSSGAIAHNHGLPRFRNCSFEAAYPFGQVLLSDPAMPVTVRLQAFNPLIPGDADRSGIPFAMLRYVVTNIGQTALTVAISGSIENFIGYDGFEGAPLNNRNEKRSSGGLQGVLLRSDGVNPNAPQAGTIALSTTASDVSTRTNWAKLNWGDTLLDFWDDFSEDGALEERPEAGVEKPMASVAARMRLEPGQSDSITFLLSWHFPNRPTWTPHGEGAWLEGGAAEAGGEIVGNYYALSYSDAWDVAVKTLLQLEALERDTLDFVESFCASDLPAVVKEAALYNLSTLRSQTCFRTSDGRFWGWEGCHDHHGSCYGSCTHVWNYEQATAFLFGDLARSMREIEFMHATRDDGHMSFRVHLPLEYATQWGIAAADGQMGCIMKLYRDWQLSGDDAMLRSLWPRAKAALSFCWIKGGWDADRDGVMEGCQHNTMDVEYYGPNPQMEVWYLGALRSAEEMAKHLGDDEFAATCHDLYERGRKWTEENLFNGEYYEHQIRPVGKDGFIAEGLRHASMGARDLDNPELQLGSGCLVDQLVGQYFAHVVGLGYLLDPAQVKSTLSSILRYNFRENLFGHFNHMRSFALADESALLMASYPRGNRPKRPFPYFNEVMTGFEYTAAIGMLYEGQIEEGLRCISAIRARYTGKRRSPFNEAECGHHYARAMASWAAVLALSGFNYSAPKQRIRFTADAFGQVFWSNGSAWGICRQERNGQAYQLTLEVKHGSLSLREIELSGAGSLTLEASRTITAGEQASFTIPA